MKDQSSLIKDRGSNIYYRKDIVKLKEINLNDSAEIIARKFVQQRCLDMNFLAIVDKKYYIIPENQYKNKLEYESTLCRFKNTIL